MENAVAHQPFPAFKFQQAPCTACGKNEEAVHHEYRTSRMQCHFCADATQVYPSDSFFWWICPCLPLISLPPPHRYHKPLHMSQSQLIYCFFSVLAHPSPFITQSNRCILLCQTSNHEQISSHLGQCPQSIANDNQTCFIFPKLSTSTK